MKTTILKAMNEKTGRLEFIYLKHLQRWFIKKGEFGYEVCFEALGHTYKTKNIFCKTEEEAVWFICKKLEDLKKESDEQVFKALVYLKEGFFKFIWFDEQEKQMMFEVVEKESERAKEIKSQFNKNITEEHKKAEIEK